MFGDSIGRICYPKKPKVFLFLVGALEKGEVALAQIDTLAKGLGGPIVVEHSKQGMEVETAGDIVHLAPVSKGQGLDYDEALVQLRQAIQGEEG